MWVWQLCCQSCHYRYTGNWHAIVQCPDTGVCWLSPIQTHKKWCKQALPMQQRSKLQLIRCMTHKNTAAIQELPLWKRPRIYRDSLFYLGFIGINRMLIGPNQRSAEISRKILLIMINVCLQQNHQCLIWHETSTTVSVQTQPSTYHSSFKINAVGSTVVSNNSVLAQPIQASPLSHDSVTANRPAWHHPPVTQRQTKLQHDSNTNCISVCTSSVQCSQTSNTKARWEANNSYNVSFLKCYSSAVHRNEL